MCPQSALEHHSLGKLQHDHIDGTHISLSNYHHTHTLRFIAIVTFSFQQDHLSQSMQLSTSGTLQECVRLSVSSS